MSRFTPRIAIALASLLIVAGTNSAAQTTSQKKSAPAVKPAASAAVPEHPVPLAANATPASCLACHSGVQSGKYVHTAMSMGCTTCHAINTEDGVTHVSLVSPANKLCETCHALSSDQVLHGPYREGLCTTCHSPHSSDFPGHTWASAQDICLGCHARVRLKVNQKAKTVTTPWGKTLTFAQMKGWRFVNLNSTLTGNHPVAGHPVTGPNRKAGAPLLSCMSCHKTHASPYKNLLTAGAPKDMKLCATCGICEQCHENLF
jgi:predicted CXXCH cytochrome family protein